MKTIFSSKTSANTIKISGEPDIHKTLPANPPSGFGQLPIDILENDKEILVIAPLAGVSLDDAEIVINDDILTIQGKREMDNELFGFKKKDYFVQECFWGEFSRSVILPPGTDPQLIEATQSDHILYIRIPKKLNIQMRIVKIKPKN